MRAMFGFALVCLALPLLIAGCASTSSGAGRIINGKPPPVEQAGQVLILYEIVSGDVLSIDGGKHQELTKDTVRVDEKGEINLIHIGKIKAAGQTKGEFEEAINDAYRESGNYENPQVSVTVLTLFYYVDGQVRIPGRKSYTREITLYRAIVDAGSFAEFAAPSRVLLLRPTPEGPTTYRINVKRIMDGREPDDVVILPNDVIRVPKSVF